MTRGTELVTVLLICLTVATGIPTQFPHGKTLVYNYYGDIKAGIIEPAAYASQFAISGQFYIKHDSSDSNLKHAYYATLRNVKIGMNNGLANHFERTNTISPIPKAAKVIEEPFLIINNDEGMLEGVKISEDEAGWSKNMKMAIATMLQLDLKNMKLESPIKHHSFISKEKTIQGECWTSYDVHDKVSTTTKHSKNFIVTKFGSPRNCTDYNVHVFNHVDTEQCSMPHEAPVNMASRRVFEIENQDDNILIKSLIAHGGVNYFPLKGRSEAHYIINNASFVLENIAESADTPLPNVDFKKIPIIDDLSYKRPENNYALNTAVDVSQGRHTIDQDDLIEKIKQMLNETADYLEEHHLDAKDPSFEHGQVINRLLLVMGLMTTASMEQVFTEIIVPTPTDRDNIIMNIFIGMIPQIGTAASTIFARDLILSQKLKTFDAIQMLGNLPLNIRTPNEQLLVEMEKLIKAGDEIPEIIRQSSILCFGSMVFRTYKNVTDSKTNVALQRYLENFYDHLINEPKYNMKITYLNAIRNIQVGKIEELLAPIIRGDIHVSDNPTYLRLMAIQAIQKAVANNYNVAHDLLWPVLANTTAPLKLRIAAYDILIRQTPTMTNILHMYWFMVYEKNEHLYNYHHTTIKSLANSVNPCDYALRELTTKIIRFTRFHAPVSYDLSTSYMVDSMDDIYGHGEKIQLSTVLSEVTGIPEVIRFEFITLIERKPVSEIAIELHIEGMDATLTKLMGMIPKALNNINNADVINLLKKAASDMPPTKELHIDLVVLRKGRAVFVNHYNKNLFAESCLHFDYLVHSIESKIKFNKQNLMYTNLFEQQIISEMGLPIVIGTRMPLIGSLNIEAESAKPYSTATLNMDLILWRHGNYFMSIYNPMMDVWHSVQRSMTVDAAVPIRIIMNAHEDLLKLTIPTLPDTKKDSTVGFKIHTKDVTTVTGDESGALRNACPTCNHFEVVTNGAAAKKYHSNTMELKDIGYQYSSSIFDCENQISPVSMQREFLRAMMFERRNSKDDVTIHSMFGAYQFIKNMIISPPMGSCGYITKLEPSTVHPTSKVDVSLRFDNSGINSDKDENGLHSILKEKSLNLRGTLEAVSEKTNASLRSWDLHANADFSNGHLNNTFKVQLTRKTPGEKTLMICIDGQKSYPSIPTDVLKVGITREETNAKLIMSMAHVNEDDSDDSLSCPLDESRISITVKGELSNEQKKLFSHESTHGLCQKDIGNPLMKTSSNLIPRTVNCIDETIRHTTLKKYTVNINHKKVPQPIMSKFYAFKDIIDTIVLPNVEYTDEHAGTGNIKIDIEFPTKNDVVDMSIVTPTQSYLLTGVSLDVEANPPRLNGFGPDYNKYLWMFPLDNTRFSVQFLNRYVRNTRKVCTLFPKLTLTLDKNPIPYEIPNEWTLASGDYMEKSFAIFVKNINGTIATKIYMEAKTIEIIPIDSGFQVTIDNQLINDVTDDIDVSSETTSNVISKITRDGDEIFVQMLKQSLLMMQTSHSMTLYVNYELQGEITGLCGHMTGDHVTKIPKEYRLKQD